MKILFTNVASKLNLLTPEDIVKQNIMPGLQETGVRVICQCRAPNPQQAGSVARDGE